MDAQQENLKGRILQTLIGALLVAMSGTPAHAAQCGNVTVGTPGLSAICGAGGENATIMLINGIANWVTGLIGGVAVLVIIISSIQLITSAGQPDGIKAAKKRIVTSITGLFVLVSMRVILNLIIAGGNF
ncbi:hypothetical protein IT414_00950 [bacterium]|nr:hypothetical protein [bacterium]